MLVIVWGVAQSPNLHKLSSLKVDIMYLNRVYSTYSFFPNVIFGYANQTCLVKYVELMKVQIESVVQDWF